MMVDVQASGPRGNHARGSHRRPQSACAPGRNLWPDSAVSAQRIVGVNLGSSPATQPNATTDRAIASLGPSRRWLGFAPGNAGPAAHSRGDHRLLLVSQRVQRCFAPVIGNPVLAGTCSNPLGPRPEKSPAFGDWLYEMPARSALFLMGGKARALVKSGIPVSTGNFHRESKRAINPPCFVGVPL